MLMGWMEMMTLDEGDLIGHWLAINILALALAHWNSSTLAHSRATKCQNGRGHSVAVMCHPMIALLIKGNLTK
jgi:hypothetical protein